MRIVQEFCDRMVNRDAEALRGFIADDAEYQNVGMPASVGVDAILANLAGQIGMFPDSYEYVMKNIAVNGDVVLTERLDMIRTPGGAVLGVPVMGTFVVRDGKIRRWHDYFDTGLPMKMMTGEDVTALVPLEY
ncbi:MAG: limonene-1,2-epoxide hydrolase family protein [Actinomycetota bacterium]|nr:limonene-1,2-epoxide hydrolase family protein [Actinomycetota bacterium]